MSDPAIALQKAVNDVLKASTALATAMGGTIRAYDRVPASYALPYLTFGDDEINDDGNSCDNDFSEAFVTVHVWSEKVGKVEAKNIGGAVRGALATEISITGFRAVVGHFQSGRYFTESDGLITHGVLTFRYLIEPV